MRNDGAPPAAAGAVPVPVPGHRPLVARAAARLLLRDAVARGLAGAVAAKGGGGGAAATGAAAAAAAAAGTGQQTTQTPPLRRRTVVAHSPAEQQQQHATTARRAYRDPEDDRRGGGGPPQQQQERAPPPPPTPSSPKQPPNRSPVPRASASATPVAEQLSVGSVLGLATGYTIRKIGRILAFVVGTEFLILQYLAYKKWLVMDWKRVTSDLQPTLDRSRWHAGMEIVLYRLPFVTAFSAGLAAGLRIPQ